MKESAEFYRAGAFLNIKRYESGGRRGAFTIMGIFPYHSYFCANISAACFKMSFPILNCRFAFRKTISSVYPGVRLAFS